MSHFGEADREAGRHWNKVKDSSHGSSPKIDIVEASRGGRQHAALERPGNGHHPNSLAAGI